MNIPLPRFIKCVLLLSLCTIFFGSLFTERSAALSVDPAAPAGPDSPLIATLGLQIKLAQDGLAPMNNVGDSVNGRVICGPTTNPTPGCDFDPHNAIVRTHDAVVYTYDYNVNGGDAADVIIKAILPLGLVWNFTPGFCLGDGPPTGDGINTQSIITCHRGTQTAGTAESLPFVATVFGKNNANGDPRTAIGILSDGPAGPPVFAGSPQVTISAAPWYNLRKTFLNSTGDGTVGYNITYIATFGVFDDYPTADALNPWYGSSELTSTIVFKDNVAGISPFAVCRLQRSRLRKYGRFRFRVPAHSPAGPGTPIEVPLPALICSLDQLQFLRATVFWRRGVCDNGPYSGNRRPRGPAGYFHVLVDSFRTV